MKPGIRAWAAAAAIVAAAGGASAQHTGHQMAAAAPEGACQEAAADARLLVDRLQDRIDSARQANSAAAMRMAVDDVQNVLASLKASLGPCGPGQLPAPAPPMASHADDASAREAPASGSTMARSDEAKNEWTIAIVPAGFQPSTITVKQGSAVKLTFLRKTDKTCGKEVEFPDYKITKALPLNEPVLIELPAAKSGTVRFTCGMNMLEGKIVVQ